MATVAFGNKKNKTRNNCKENKLVSLLPGSTFACKSNDRVVIAEKVSAETEKDEDIKTLLLFFSFNPEYGAKPFFFLWLSSLFS